MPKKKPNRKKGRKASPKKRRAGNPKTKRSRKPVRRQPPEPPRRRSPLFQTVEVERRGLGSAAAGQSGDIEGLPEIADVDSESVEELAEEGQDFEAEVVSGVEEAPDPDQGELTFDERPDDESPSE
jgi:hypothetical protein